MVLGHLRSWSAALWQQRGTGIARGERQRWEERMSSARSVKVGAALLACGAVVAAAPALRGTAAQVALEDLAGLRIVGLVNAGGDVRGLELGLVNIANEVSGIQVGVLNLGGSVTGRQLGLINLTDAPDAAWGLITLLRHPQREPRAAPCTARVACSRRPPHKAGPS
jgi:hypothetical protein